MDDNYNKDQGGDVSVSNYDKIEKLQEELGGMNEETQSENIHSEVEREESINKQEPIIDKESIDSPIINNINTEGFEQKPKGTLMDDENNNSVKDTADKADMLIGIGLAMMIAAIILTIGYYFITNGKKNSNDNAEKNIEIVLTPIAKPATEPTQKPSAKYFNDEIEDSEDNDDSNKGTSMEFEISPTSTPCCSGFEVEE